MRLDKFENGLPITGREIFALKTYQGVGTIDRARGKRYAKTIYRTINAMLYPGIDNEIERVFKDDEILNGEHIKDAEELLEIMKNLYSVSYKNATNMKEDEHGVRIDRVSSIEKMKKEKEILSNFSVSANGKYNPSFIKNEMALVEVNIKPKTICSDINYLLKEESYFPSEREILVMPFNKVTVEEKEINEKDRKIKNSKGNEAKLKVYVTIEPPPKARPLTKEESKDKERAMKIFKDKSKRENAKEFLNDIQIGNMSGKDGEETLKTIQEKEIKDYIEWKEAFRTVFKYEVREKQLEIDKQLEEIQIKRERKKEEIRKLTEGRNLTGLKEAIQVVGTPQKDNMLKEFETNIERGK